MNDQSKTKDALIAELQALRQQVARLESQLETPSVPSSISPRDQVDLSPASPESIGPLGGFTQDLRTGAITWSPGMFVITGLDPRGFSGDLRAISEQIVHPDDLAIVHAQTARMIAERQTWPIEFRIVRHDGEVRLLRSGTQFVLDEEGVPVEVYGVHFDITEQRRLADEVQTSAHRYRFLAEHIHDVIWTMDCSMRFTYISPSVERLLGYVPGDILQRALTELLFPDILAEVTGELVAIEDALATRDCAPAQQRLVLPLHHKQGYGIWVEVVTSPLCDESGNCVGILGVARDITERREVELALRESQEQFALFMEYLPGAVFIKDSEGHLKFCNRNFAMAAGTTPDQILGKRSEEYMELEAAAAFIEENRSVLQENRVCRYEHAFPAPDGLSYWLTIKFPIPRGDRTPLLGSMSLEITERKRMEAALAESEQRFRLVAQSVSDLIYEWDIASGTLRWFGDIDGALGYDLGAFPRTLAGWLDHIHPDDRARLQDSADLRIANTTSILDQYRIHGKDGLWRYWLDHGEPILDGEGKPVRWVGACIDVTAQQRLDMEREMFLEQIRAQAWRTQQIVENVPEGVLLVDGEGTVLLSNPAGDDSLRILAGIDPGERLVKLGDCAFTAILSPPERLPWYEITAGSHVFEVSAHPIREDGGEADLWVLVLRDVTWDREAQHRAHLQERLATVGQLAAGIAHDFNNVLATIVLYAQMLEQHADLNVGDRRYLKTIIAQAQHATGLITQILDFSRSEDFDREDMDLIPLVKEAVKLWQRTFPENIRVSLDYAESDLIVCGEPNRLNQVLTNLALNARDAMDEGGNLHVDLCRVVVSHDNRPVPEMPPGTWVRIAVQDTGTGITSDVLPHIFEPFFTTKVRGRGTGLGLPQVYGIVQTHNGYIDVQTEVGSGTIFVIYLPAVCLEEVDGPRTDDEGALAVGCGERILVVEDNVMLRGALANTLKGLNYCVVEAENGVEALALLADQEAVSEERIRLVITDMVMPEMGGKELLETIHARGYRVGVIILTGYSIESARDVDLPELVAWQHKPIDLIALANAIAEGLAR